MIVHLLWHMRPLDETDADETDDTLCGAFSSAAKAEAARQLVGLPGFRDFPDDFLVDEILVDQVTWTDGFVSVGSGE